MDPREILSENNLCYAKADLYPATKLHSLLIPKRHVPDFFSLLQPEISAAYALLNELKTTIQGMDNTVTGFTIGANSGEDAGQTIFHCHIHLIPRRKGDTNNPRGGVRKAIMNTQESRSAQLKP